MLVTVEVNSCSECPYLDNEMNNYFCTLLVDDLYENDKPLHQFDMDSKDIKKIRKNCPIKKED